MTIREIYKNSEQFLNKEVKLAGWIQKHSWFKTFRIFSTSLMETFSNRIYFVYEEKLANFQEISKMNVGAAVIVEGILVPTPQAKQPFEIQATSVTLRCFCQFIIEKASQLRIFKNNFSSSSKNEYVPGSISHPFWQHTWSPVSRRLCLCAYTTYNSK